MRRFAKPSIYKQGDVIEKVLTAPLLCLQSVCPSAASQAVLRASLTQFTWMVNVWSDTVDANHQVIEPRNRQKMLNQATSVG